jgi:calcineurin-like phosphoesterase family protein
MYFFTADHHFNHANVIKYARRPFESVEEMDEELINRWNSKVQLEDIVFHLGDFTLSNEKVAQRYFARLNGNVMILSNPAHHDKRWIKTPQFTKSGQVKLISPLKTLEIENGKYPLVIVICHFPIGEWDRKHYGSIHLHAHSHGTYKGEGNILDVGVDCHDYYPVSLTDIIRRFK